MTVTINSDMNQYPNPHLNAGGVVVSDFEWVKNLTHIPFGLMERRRRERHNAQIVAALGAVIGEEFLEGGSEIGLVRTGLDDVMRGAYERMTATLKAHPEMEDFRTAAYYIALNQIADAYKAIGI